MNSYEIHRAQYMSREMTEGVIALDAMSLDACYHVSADDDHALFSLNRENGVVVTERETGRVVAYSMLLPMTSPRLRDDPPRAVHRHGPPARHGHAL